MSQHEDETHLRDMLDYAQRAIGACAATTREDFLQDRILQGAIERFVEIIGEAVGRVSEVRQSAISDIPWKQIIGMRNRLAHGYADTDYGILWNVVRRDLPDLREKLEREVDRA